VVLGIVNKCVESIRRCDFDITIRTTISEVSMYFGDDGM